MILVGSQTFYLLAGALLISAALVSAYIRRGAQQRKQSRSQCREWDEMTKGERLWLNVYIGLASGGVLLAVARIARWV